MAIREPKEFGRFNIRMPEEDAAPYREVAALLDVTVPTFMRTILAQSVPQVKAMAKALREVKAGDDEAAAATFRGALTALGVQFDNLVSEVDDDLAKDGR